MVSQSLIGAAPNTCPVSDVLFFSGTMAFDEDDDFDMDEQVENEIAYCEMMALEEAAQFEAAGVDHNAQDFAAAFGMVLQEPECDPEPVGDEIKDGAHTDADAERQLSLLPVAEVDMEETVTETSSMPSSPGPRVVENTSPKRYRLRESRDRQRDKIIRLELSCSSRGLIIYDFAPFAAKGRPRHGHL